MVGRPPIGKRAMTGAERVRRYRLLHATDKPVTKPAATVTKQASTAALARITELEQLNAALVTELAHAKARIAELEARGKQPPPGPPPFPHPRTPEEWAALRLRVKQERKAERAAKQAAKPVKPPLPPDEERDRKIKTLTTRVRNVTAELRHFKQYHEREMTERELMSRDTSNAVAMCLHPDQRRNATEADKDDAYKLFNAWKDDSNRAHRKGRGR